MTKVVFWEKPGCINNTKQRAMLSAAGFDLEVRSLLTEPWTPEALRLFFEGLPVPRWFNRSAPRIKSGELSVDTMTREEALVAMCSDPLLIRRPLLMVGTSRHVGFELSEVERFLGASLTETERGAKIARHDLESCPRLVTRD